MACCDCEDHDYCCRCSLSEAQRAQSIIADVLDGTYDKKYAGEIDDLPKFSSMTFGDSNHAAQAIVAVLKHEHIV